MYVKIENEWSFLSSEVHATSKESAILRFDTRNHQIKAVECFRFDVYIKDNDMEDYTYLDSIWSENETSANLLARKNLSIKSKIDMIVRKADRK